MQIRGPTAVRTGHTTAMRSPALLVRRRILVALALMLVAAACGSDDTAGTAEPAETTTAAPRAPAIEVPDVSGAYDDLDLWHCHPDKAEDVCSSGFDATRVEPDGTFTPVPFVPATAPEFDCFYVYPTLDYSPTPGNHSFDEANPLEPVTVQGQVGRFGELCRMFVPRYQQATIGSYDAAVDGRIFDVPAFATAYADVLGAFHHYLAEENDGRPFVLLGHSQGSHHLTRLLQDEFDDDEALRSQLISALLVGATGRVRVPEGENLGATFQNLPLCAVEDQTGCVVSFDSYAGERPPDYPAPTDGTVSACVNPADLSGDRARLAGAYFGRTIPEVPTFYELIEDYYTATCAVTADGLAYLEVDPDPAPGDTRDLRHIETQLATSDSLHTLDYNFTLGDLLALVRRQAAGF